MALTLIHLVGIPVTNTSVNPARSTGPSLFVGGWAIAQLWLFWLAPLAGGALGGALYRWISAEPTAPVVGGVRSEGQGHPAASPAGADPFLGRIRRPTPRLAP